MKRLISIFPASHFSRISYFLLLKYLIKILFKILSEDSFPQKVREYTYIGMKRLNSRLSSIYLKSRTQLMSLNILLFKDNLTLKLFFLRKTQKSLDFFQGLGDAPFSLIT